MWLWLAHPLGLPWWSFGSSALLIGWGLSYVRKKDHRRDMVLLTMLGVIDLLGAFESERQVEQLQAAVAPRHLTERQRKEFISTLHRFRIPKKPIVLHFGIDGSDRDRSEQMQFGKELQSAMEEAGFQVNADEARLQPVFLGVRLSAPSSTPEENEIMMRTQDVSGDVALAFHAALDNAQVLHTLQMQDPTQPVTLDIGRR